MLTKRPLELKRLVFFVPALGWAALIASLSTTSNLPRMPLEWLSPDKIGHLVFYGILAGWLFWGCYRSNATERPPKRYIYASALLAALYGAALEGVQARLPHRQFDYADMLANCIGVLLALGYWHYRQRHS